MEMIGLHKMYLTIISITIIFASMVLVTFPEFRSSAIAQGQGSNMTSPSLTPEQKAAMCDPNDKFVNDTESSVCGIPPTPTNTTTTSSDAANTTTGAEVSSKALAPQSDSR
jgi:hypothetical protein